MVKIRGMKGSLDFVAYKIKWIEELPIADMDSTVSTEGSLIDLIHTHSTPLYYAIKTDFAAPGTLSSVAVDVPAT